MNEKGFLMGLAQASKVIRSYEGESKYKLPDGENRELLTVIECISGDGRIVPSLIIINTNHDMGWHRFTSYDEESQQFRLLYGREGWTDRILRMEWLVEVFDKETCDQANGCCRYVT